MILPSSATIRFQQGQFRAMRQRLLKDSGNEAFALLYGKQYEFDDVIFIKVIDTRYPTKDDYEGQSISHLRLKKEFIYDCLVEIQERDDIDIILDVHTHPFCERHVQFSGVDDSDEKLFYCWLIDTLDGLSFGSVVLSQSDYSARIWQNVKVGDIDHKGYILAKVKTQTVNENWPDSNQQITDDRVFATATDAESGFLARSVLALGIDNLRNIMRDQTITIVGVGGLGSVIAENLIHSGFQNLNLVDHDDVEVTNLNRIVGAYYVDAVAKRLKVDVVKEHLQRINPAAKIEAYSLCIEDDELLPAIAGSDWLLVGTDNHSSRYKAQQLAIQFGVPLLTAGVNITVVEEEITDMSGEVIVARSGDRVCLNCLGRINPTKVAAEQNQGEMIGDQLVARGYVTGKEVKDPAVKTLNAIVGAMAVDTLINQYTHRQPHKIISVYESNRQCSMYADEESVSQRNKQCLMCS